MATRTFLDGKGVQWSVVEVTPSGGRAGLLRPQFEHGWLLFISEDERRRFAPPPRRWADVSESELRRLLALAETTAPARYPDRRPVD